MFSLIRALNRSFFVNGHPLSQVIIGILLIPAGGLISWAGFFGDPNYQYPYLAVGGIVLAILGIILIVKGIKRLLVWNKPGQPHQTQSPQE